MHIAQAWSIYFGFSIGKFSNEKENRMLRLTCKMKWKLLMTFKCLIKCFSSSQASMFHLFTVLFHCKCFFFQVDYKTRFILQVSNIYLVIPFNFVFVSKQTLNEKCKLKILRKTKRKFASIQIWNEREERAIDRDWAKDKTKNSKSRSNNQTDQSLANELKKKRKENSNQTKRRRNI